MSDFSRLTEHAFPLKQASLDSVHEKNVRHGHISTLHIWPARRPLAACRATIPLLKTRWLCKKANKRVLLTIRPNADGTGVDFGVERNVPVVRGNAARRRSLVRSGDRARAARSDGTG